MTDYNDLFSPDSDFYKSREAAHNYTNLAPILEKKGMDTSFAVDPNFIPEPLDATDEVTDEVLMNEKNFQTVGRILYDMDASKRDAKEEAYEAPEVGIIGSRQTNTPRTDVDFGRYALEQLGFFNYNMAQMGYDTITMQKAEPYQRLAFYYGMNAYDRLKNFTKKGTARFFKGVLSDPSTYLGLGSLGLVTRQLAKQAGGKNVLLNLIKNAGVTGAVGGVEGGAYGAMDNYFRQEIGIEAGGQKDFNFDELLKAAGYSAAAGGVLGGSIPVLGALGKQAVDVAKRVEIDDSATLSANPIPFRLKDKTIKSLDDIKNKYPKVDLSLSIKPEGITLSKIVVPENNRSEGVGTKVMNDLINFADENNLKIALTPDNSFGGSKTRLKEFYKKFGFVNNKGRNKDFAFRETLIRQPKNKEARKSVIEQRRKEANIDRFGYDPNDPTQNKKVEARPRDESSGHAADIVPANFGPPANDMNMRIEEEFSPEGISTFSTDVGNNYENLKTFITSRRGTKEHDQEVAFFRKLFDIKGNPDAEVTIYRASPTNDLRPGDLVTPIKADAESYVEQSKVTRQDIRDAEKKRRLEGDQPVDLAKEKTIKKMDAIMDVFPETKVTPSKVFTYKVKAKDLRWDGNNGLVRWGYFPQDNVTEIKKQ